MSDEGNYQIREIVPNGTINTVAGNGIQGFSGDGGAATSASLSAAFGVGLDPSGNLLIADSGNNRIREVSAVSPVTPFFTSTSVTNSASFASGGSAGGLATVFGQHLSVNLSGVADATSIPISADLAGTSITVNGTPAPLLAVVNAGGSEQINFQMPWEVAGQSTVQVVIDNGVSSSASVPVTVTDAQPGIFVVDSASDGAITHLDNSLVSAANPANPGEILVMYGTGFGPVSPVVVTGQVPTSLSNTTLTPVITIADLPVTIDFSGEAPGFVGLSQLNIVVPSDAPAGALPLVVSSGGVTGKTVMIQVN